MAGANRCHARQSLVSAVMGQQKAASLELPLRNTSASLTVLHLLSMPTDAIDFTH